MAKWHESESLNYLAKGEISLTRTRQVRREAHLSNEMTKIEITHAWKLCVDLLKPRAFVHTLPADLKPRPMCDL